jgi:hypothetical protein
MYFVKAIPVCALTCIRVDQESIKKFLIGDSTLQEASMLLDWVFSENGKKELLDILDKEWQDKTQKDGPFKCGLNQSKESADKETSI